MFYLVTVRAVALEVRAHNTTYLLVMLLFFAAVIEFGVIVGGDISDQFVSDIYFIYSPLQNSWQDSATFHTQTQTANFSRSQYMATGYCR